MVNVVFVDDERRLLDGLVRAVRASKLPWRVRVAESGPAALALLDAEPAEVVVSDMRMPGMNGAQLLEVVQGRYPETLRYILTGHAEQECVLRASAVAHRFLTKPCDLRYLGGVVERSRRLREMLASPELRSWLSGVGHLPSGPTLYAQLTRALANPRVSLRDVSEIVRSDPAIAAKVLQLANSAFFQGIERAGGVEAAIARLGFSMLRRLVLMADCTRGFDSLPFDLDEFQVRSLRASLIAAQLAADGQAVSGVHRIDPDEAATATLLCDLGYLILGSRVEWAMGDVATERARLGLSHAEVGAWLLDAWGLPESIVEAVAVHHEPDRLGPGPGAHFCALVSAAAAIASKAPVPESVTALVGAETTEAWIAKARACALPN